MLVKFRVMQFTDVVQEDEESWSWSDVKDTGKIYELDCDESGALNEEGEKELWQLMRDDGF